MAATQHDTAIEKKYTPSHEHNINTIERKKIIKKKLHTKHHKRKPKEGKRRKKKTKQGKQTVIKLTTEATVLPRHPNGNRET